ncbi:MAG: hypothetical protein KBT47_07805 [Armatimonadetes bacterium]|nr:hypothetical protein [Candidatus Hippobium faecium]
MKILFALIFVLLFAGSLFADSFAFSPSVPGALYYPKDKREANVSVNVADGDKAVIKLTFADPYGNVLNSYLKEITLLKTENFTKTVELPFYNGFVKVLCEVKIYSEDKLTNSFDTDFRYAVIPANFRNFKDVDSPFGVNCHFNQGWDPAIGKIVKRVGIEYVRDGETRPDDLSAPVCIENNLCYMPCFTHIADPSWQYIKKETENGKTSHDKWNFSGYLDDYSLFAKKYGWYVDYYDIANEPSNVPYWSALGGSWYGGEWTKVFRQWGEQVAKNIKKNDSNAQIVWEDGGPQLWLRQFVKQGLNPKYIDAISPHPYNLHKNLNLPEDTETIEDYALTALFLKENKYKNLPFIIGELGVSSYEKSETYDSVDGFYSSTTELEQAQQVVRHLTTAFARGVKKFFYYDFKNDLFGPDRDPYNPENNFGLMTEFLTPKPSVVAYANFIDRTRECQWLGRYTTGAGCFAYAVKNPKTNTGTIIIWSKKGEKTTQLFHCDNCPDTLQTYDIFGNKKQIISKEPNNIFNIKVDETPQYIPNYPLEDFEWTVYKHDYLK